MNAYEQYQEERAAQNSQFFENFGFFATIGCIIASLFFNSSIPLVIGFIVLVVMSTFLAQE